MPDPALPLVSVVTPVYNGVRFLRRAANSVRRQTFAGWEHLLVDDGSADASWELMTAYAGVEPRARIFRHAANGGQSAARNTALRQARGEWIAYLDHDDEFYPDYLDRILHHRDQGDVLLFDYDLLEERPGHSRFGRTTTWSPGQARDRLWTETIAVPLGVAHRRSLLDQVGLFDESMAIEEEADLWRRFARAGARFVFLSERSGLYHVRADSHARRVLARPAQVTVEFPLGDERYPIVVSADDVEVVRRVFQNQKYAVMAAHLLRVPPTILDVGAHVGAFALYAKLFYHRRAVVHCFEPFPPSAELLRQNLAGLQGVHVHPAALADRDGEAELLLHPTASARHSLVPGRFNGPVRRLTVPVRDAGRSWDELGLDEVDVLKVAAEGSELAILQSLGRRLTRVRLLLLEYHTAQDRRQIEALLSDFEPLEARPASPEAGMLIQVRRDLL